MFFFLFIISKISISSQRQPSEVQSRCKGASGSRPQGHSGLKTSRLLGLKTSRIMGLKASSLLGLKTSRLLGLKTSRVQGVQKSGDYGLLHLGFKASRHLRFKASDHMGFKVVCGLCVKASSVCVCDVSRQLRLKGSISSKHSGLKASNILLFNAPRRLFRSKCFGIWS